MPIRDPFDRACPCGSGMDYDACCGPLLRGTARAETAEQLMRSRYCAHALGEADHLFRTWHPRTRPADVGTDPHLRWSGLTVLSTEAGGAYDDEGVVEFEARWESPRGSGHLRERSRFVRRAGRWVYLDGAAG